MDLRVSLFTIIVLCVSAFPSFAQEPDSRADALKAERDKKATALQPPERPGLERLLLDLESGRLFERFLNPAEGLYPKIFNVTPGSGISMGPAYRKPGLFGGHVDLETFAAASFKRYWMVDAHLRMPRLANERVALEVHGQRYSFPEEEFFGIGPDSNRDELTIYGIKSSVVGGSGTYSPVSWLSFRGGVDWLAPDIEAGTEPGDLLSIFTPAQTPGVSFQPDFFKYEGVLGFNYSRPRGNPRVGGAYFFTAQKYEDRDGGLYSFNRFEADFRQYVPILKDRRIIALRALASVSDAETGATIPFYMLRTLGGPDDLRGFRRYRFRDRNALLLQAEYRWEIFSALDGAIFYDTGKVASRAEDLTLDDLESDYGIGFRFGNENGVFLRVEGAFGSSGGKHFILRFGNVF